jgi:hypothetical protein
MPKSKQHQKKRQSHKRGAAVTHGAHGALLYRSLANNISAVPQSMRTKLVWNYVGADVIPPAGTFKEMATILLNSPYDPDASLGGASAQGFVKLMAFYSKCFTTSAKVTVTFANTGSTTGYFANSTALGILTVTTNSTVLPNANQAIEQGLCVYKLLNTSPDSAVLSNTIDIGRFLDKPDVLDDPQLFCTSAANPGQVVVAHFAVYGYSASASTYISYNLNVEMDVTFTDPIPFA